MKRLLLILLITGLAAAWKVRLGPIHGRLGETNTNERSGIINDRAAWNKRNGDINERLGETNTNERGGINERPWEETNERLTETNTNERSGIINDRGNWNRRIGETIETTGIVFKPANEYIFKYETQVLTGIPTLNTQHSGLKIIGTVRAQIKSDFTVIAKLENVEMYQINREVPKIVPTEIVPTELFTKVSPEIARVITEHLIKPFSFKYESGYVSSIMVPAGEPDWCINLKRGIINLFQIDLTQKNPIGDTTREVEEILMENNIEMSGPMEAAYRVMEPGVSGECESLYTIVPGPEMAVTKIRNFKNCIAKPVWEQGIFSNIGVLPMLLNKTRNLIQAFSHCNYIISGDRNNFLIKKAVLTGSYIFTPLTEEKGSIATNIVQILQLINTRPIGTPITPTGNMIPLTDGLIMRVALMNYGAGGNMEPGTGGNVEETWNTGTGERPRSPENPIYGEYYSGQSKIQVVEPLLERIVRNVYPIVTPEAPTLITKLVVILRECTVGEIETLINTHVTKTASSPEIMKKREVILDILPVLPRPDIVPIITRLIRERIVTPFRGAFIINLMTLTMPACPMAINSLVSIVRDPTIRQNKQVFRAVMLGIGAITNKLAVGHRKLALRTSIEPIVQKVIPVVRELLSSGVIEEKLLGLKTIGNAGLPQFLPIILPLIKDRSVPIIVRTHAIYACRKIAPLLRTKIQTTLLPIFMNPAEPREVRIAGFLTIMESRPFYSTIQVIAHQLNTETSMQVASFVYSYIHTLSTIRHPSLIPVANMARKVLLITKPIKTGFIYSKAAVLDIYAKSLDVGALVKLNIINSPRSIVPEAFIAQLTTHIFGKPVEAAEIGIEARGLTEIVRNVLGPNSIVYDIINGKASLKDIFSPRGTTEWGSVASEVEAILKSMTIPEETTGPETDLISLYVKLFGNELRFLSFDIAHIRNLISTGEFKLVEIDRMLREGYKMNLLKTLPLVDNAIVIPTPAGIPLSLNLTVVPVVNIDGIIKLEGLESIIHMITRPIPEQVKAIVDVNPSVAVEVMAAMGVDLTLLKIGTGINAVVRSHMPVKMETTINTRSMTFENVFHVPRQELKALTVTIKPITFIATRPLVPTPNVIEINAKVIRNPVAYTIPISRPIACPLLGLEFVIDGIVTLGAAGWSPVWPLSGKQMVEVIIKPTPQTPAQIKTTISYGTPGSIPAMTINKPGSSWFSWPWGSSSNTPNTPNTPNYRTVQRTPMPSGEFMPIRPFHAITSPITKKIFVRIEGVGGGSTGTCQSQITWIHSPRFRKHQINIQVITAPLIATIPGTWKIMTEAAVDLTKIINYPTSGTPNPEIVGKVAVMFGRNTFEESAIIVNVLTGEAGISSREVFLPLPQTTTITPTVYTLTTTIEYKQIPHIVLPPLMMVLDVIKVQLFPWVRPMITIRPIPVENNKIKVICRIVPSFARVTAAVITPLNLNYIIDVPITTPLLTYATNIISPYPMKVSIPGIYPAEAIPGTYAYVVHGECKVNGNNVVTFDGVNVNIPAIPETCEMIIARDCSPASRFTLIATAHTTQPKIIKLLTPGHKIDIVPSGSQINVIVNGIQKPITGAPIIIHENPSRNRGPVVAEVRMENGRTIVNCIQYGITVITDGTQMITKLHPTFKGKTCGICGNFDGEWAVEHTSRTGMNSMPQNSSNYISRYIIPSGSCPANRIMAVVPQEMCSMVRRNVVVDKVVQGVSKKCFTINPVKICPTGCRPTKTVTETMPVYCMPVDSTALRLEEECKNNILHALASKPISHREPIPVPAKCVRIF